MNIENLCDPHLFVIVKHYNHHQNNNTTIQSCLTFKKKRTTNSKNNTTTRKGQMKISLTMCLKENYLEKILKSEKETRNTKKKLSFEP